MSSAAGSGEQVALNNSPVDASEADDTYFQQPDARPWASEDAPFPSRMHRNKTLNSGRMHSAISMKTKIRDLVEDPASSRAASTFQACIVFLIVASTFAASIETLPEMRGLVVFIYIEVTVTLLFTMELCLRLFASESAYTFATNAFNIIDLLAILPGAIEIGRVTMARVHQQTMKLGAAQSLRFIRLLRLVRILRLAKVARHSALLSICVTVFAKVWHSSLLVMAALLAGLVVVSASIIYYLESDRHEVLGVECKGFDSIPAACWFTIITLTSVGYGDLMPATQASKLVSGLLCVLAVGIVGLFGALLSSDFAEHFREERRARSWREVQQLQRRGRYARGHAEVQELTREFRNACDELVAQLWRSTSEDSMPRTAQPMLRIISDRASFLCSEVQSFALACALASENMGHCEESWAALRAGGAGDSNAASERFADALGSSTSTTQRQSSGYSPP